MKSNQLVQEKNLKNVAVEDDQLSILIFLFGKNFERAIRIVDQKGVVGESKRKEEYFCFPEHFCACYSFYYDIVIKAEQPCCKHQLAARLAASLKSCIEVEASDEQLALLLSKLYHVMCKTQLRNYEAEPVDTGEPYSEYSNKGKTFITVTH
ncbi:hypothetical protein TIFTF001_007057 [Ficus carica]|uniref:SWIM-type domain-containing protein n=1 Tax=Ficus carica TaxID=3494 RepID=A0AA87ZSH1_FICCA|nr:hypothetical protein TIFTF001_007057 [Ficus carica]